MTEQAYDTETLKRELERILPPAEERDYAMPWEIYLHSWEGRSGLIEVALKHARRDKSLTGAKVKAVFDANGGRGIDLIDWGDLFVARTEVGMRLDTRRVKGEGATIDEAIDALWEAVCLRGGE